MAASISYNSTEIEAGKTLFLLHGNMDAVFFLAAGTNNFKLHLVVIYRKVSSLCSRNCNVNGVFSQSKNNNDIIMTIMTYIIDSQGNNSLGNY